tara:strand:- start:748 stop:1827 length:1080 start_codon:yes stop_codon:yes gene_type:complete
MMIAAPKSLIKMLGHYTMEDKNKTAFVTGITGQDGGYLAELLLNKGYQVHALYRRTSHDGMTRIKNIINHDNLHLHHGDLTDTGSLIKLFDTHIFNEVYNLAAQSHVRVSFDVPEYTADVDAMGVLRLLECIRTLGMEEHTKFYQASTSELYGKVQETPQKETTPFYPRSPYGVSKQFAYWMVVNYREAYNIHASNGILFNHESPYRGRDFVTQKVVKGVVDIQNATTNYISVGNLDAKRDWGHAKDYVEGMYLMVQQPKPDDYVLATGKLHSIRQMIEKCFDYFDNKITWDGDGLDEVGVDKYGDVVIRVDPKYYRPAEVDLLCGDATKAKNVLGWEPKYTFDDMLEEMLDSALKFSD